MRLYIHMLGAEQALGPRDRKLLRVIDRLASGVVPLTGITFSVLVGQDRPHGIENHRAREVLRGDQLDSRGLSILLASDDIRDLGVSRLERIHWIILSLTNGSFGTLRHVVSVAQRPSSASSRPCPGLRRFASRFTGTSTEPQDDRCAIEAELLADRILQIAPVGEVD